MNTNDQESSSYIDSTSQPIARGFKTSKMNKLKEIIKKNNKTLSQIGTIAQESTENDPIEINSDILF
jgi:hypothetical protein